MKKISLLSLLVCLLGASVGAKDITLTGSIISTHDEAGGGYGIQTSKGVYGICYVWDNPKIVKILESLEPTGKTVKLKGKQTDKWSIKCDSTTFIQK